ncbi:MAG TPA: ASCH domain-containing protein [Ignavibacteria bacterium]
MKILLSIKPEFANKIFNGEKRFEYRRTIFKNSNIKIVVVYASSPVRKVIGEFHIEEVISDKPKKVWKLTHDYSGISKEYFEQYAEEKDMIHAIKIGITKRYRKQLSLQEDFDIKYAPQSFVYL